MTDEYRGRMDDRTRKIVRVLALLIGLRSFSNLFKPFGAGTGLVFFGVLLEGVANTILAPLFGVFMLTLAWAAWNFRSFALPMSVAYAAYVPLNMVLFAVANELPDFPLIFGVLYLLVGVGTTAGLTALLYRHRDLLR